MLAAVMLSGASPLQGAEPPAPAAASLARARDTSSYVRRDDVRQFIAEMVQRHGFVQRELETLFGKAQFKPDIVRAITPPAEAPVRSWQNYRAMFVNQQRVQAGLRFRERNAEALRRAAAQFGVPEEIIIAIIGVETVYGRNMGRYRVIDALMTLAFDYPRRAEYFRAELEHFLIYARDSGMDTLGVRGSFAGAIGIPQFMPGSYRRFAVDFDGDGQANLTDSATDAIGSVANYLKEHGWERDRPVAFPAAVNGDAWRKITDSGIKPAWRVADLPGLGVLIDPAAYPAAAALPPETSATLADLETPGQPTVFWVGLQNFYAITRYNRSSFYAIAVLELANALRSGFTDPATAKAP